MVAKVSSVSFRGKSISSETRNGTINKLAGYSHRTTYNKITVTIDFPPTIVLIIISACSNFSQPVLRGCRNLIYQHEKSFFLFPLMVFLEISLKNRNMYLSLRKRVRIFFLYIYIQWLTKLFFCSYQ